VAARGCTLTNRELVVQSLIEALEPERIELCEDTLWTSN
jgi:hypothetical protein